MLISEKRKLLRYVTVIILLIAGVFCTIILWQIIVPFLIAVFLSYILAPWLKRMDRLAVPLPVSLIIIYLYILLTLYLILFLTVPIILEQLRNLLAFLPEFFNSFSSVGDSFFQAVPDNNIIDLKGLADNMVQSVEMRLADLGDKMADTVFSLPKLLLYLVLSPILSYYFLRERHKIYPKILALVSPNSQKEFLRLMGEMDHLLHQFINGYLVISLIIAIMSTVFYYIIGIDYPLVLGITMGIAELIPYFGPFIGAIPAVLLALSMSKSMALVTIVGILIIQQLEGAFITPRVVGKRVGLHPLITIFSVMAGGYLWGIVGAILAVPLAAMLILLSKYLMGCLFANNNLRNMD